MIFAILYTGTRFVDQKSFIYVFFNLFFVVPVYLYYIINFFNVGININFLCFLAMCSLISISVWKSPHISLYVHTTSHIIYTVLVLELLILRFHLLLSVIILFQFLVICFKPNQSYCFAVIGTPLPTSLTMTSVIFLDHIKVYSILVVFYLGLST